jgi:hypothetical protein
MIRFACPSCNRTLQAPENRGGTTAVCPGCREQMHIPLPAPQPEAVPYAEYRELPPRGPQPAPDPSARRAGDEYDEPGAGPEVGGPLPRRRPERPSGNWAWRWCSPSMLLLSLLLLPLPFLGVQCEGPGMTMNLINQSGLQVMVGGHSIDSSIERFQKQMQGMGVPVNAGQGPFGGGAASPDLKVKAAWCVAIIPFLLLAGIAVGLAVRPTGLRVPLVASAVFGALVLLFIQMAVGFPLDKEVRDAIDREMKRGQQQFNALGGAPGGNPFGAPGAGGAPFPPMRPNPFAGPGAQANAMAREMVRTRYTAWFWIWLVLIVGSLGPLVGETIWALTRRSRRWRPAYSEDY